MKFTQDAISSCLYLVFHLPFILASICLSSSFSSVGFLSFAFPFFSFFLCSRFYLSSQSSANMAIPLAPLCSVSLYASHYMLAVFIVVRLDERSHCAIFVCTFRTQVRIRFSKTENGFVLGFFLP